MPKPSITSLHHWLKNPAPLVQSRSKSRIDLDSLAGRVFPRFVLVTCNYVNFLLVCALSDWLGYLFWVWFYDAQLETVLLQILEIASFLIGCDMLKLLPKNMSTDPKKGPVETRATW